MPSENAVKCIGGGLVVTVYAIYVGAHMLSGLPPPDGPLFISVVTALAAFLGVRKGTEALQRARSKR